MLECKTVDLRFVVKPWAQFLHGGGCRLKYFEEVFTSEHWMMRIYRVLPPPEREGRQRNPRRSRAARKAIAARMSKRRKPSGAPSS